MATPSSSARDIAALSVSHWLDPFVSVALIATAFFLLRDTSLTNVQLALIITSVTSAYLFASELMRAPWRLEQRPPQSLGAVLDRTVTKFMGVLLGIAAMLFAIWLFPAYDNARNMHYLLEALLPVLACILPLSFILIAVTEYILGESRDGTYQFGLLLRLRLEDIDWSVLRDGVLEWLVRFIFLLINFYSAVAFLAGIRERGIPTFSTPFPEFIVRLDGIIFALILFAILPGYLFASRLIRTHVKRIDRTWFGWAITLSCYAPLNAAVFENWVRYRPDPEMYERFQGMPAWAYATSEVPLFLVLVGAFIIATGLLHLWGEAILGIRSSNLSMRGIVTIGPFRYTKHPVYVSKCIQWGFIYLPFLNAIDILSAIQSTLLFLLVCALFAGRALAEEKLLAEDPTYVAYALHMDEHGVFAPIGRYVPFMSFRWRYRYWIDRGFIPAPAQGSPAHFPAYSPIG